MITLETFNKILFFIPDNNTEMYLSKLFKYLYISDMYVQETLGIKSSDDYFASELSPIPLNIWTNLLSGKFQEKFKEHAEIIKHPSSKISISNLRTMKIRKTSDIKFDPKRIKNNKVIIAMENIRFIYKDAPASAMHEKFMLKKNYWKMFVEAGSIGESAIINSIVPVGDFIDDES